MKEQKKWSIFSFAGYIALLAVVTVMLLCRQNVLADGQETFTSGDYTYTVNDDGTLTITGYTGSDTEIEIPAEIDGKKVTVIGKKAFYNCQTLEKVVIDEGILEIQTWAFSGCNNLKKIIIPLSVDHLGKSDYFDGGYISGVWLGGNLTSAGPIGSGCDIEFGWTDKIPDRAFYSYGNLVDVTLPDSVISIGSDAFTGCDNLKTVTIENGIKFFDEIAFVGCGSITTIRGLTGSYAEAFAKQKGYTFESIGTYDVPKFAYEVNDDGETLTITGYNGFADTEIEIPAEIDGKKVTVIGVNAFDNGDTLEKVVIDEGIEEIQIGAFSGCYNLKKIIIPSSVENVGKSNYDAGGYSIGKWLGGNLTSAGPIGSGCDIEFGWTDKIPDYAFFGYGSLVNVILPESITSIGSLAFDPFPEESNIAEITIPKSVTSIGSGAFEGCEKLTEIAIPENVTSIGDNAFSNCDNIAEITIPKNVTSLGGYAFSSCDNLKTVTIENGAKFFADTAFNYCDNITTIRGLTGSYAEVFAKEKGYTFESIGTYDVPEFSYEVNEDGETLTITGYNKFADTIEVPSELDGKKVTAIGKKAFYNYEKNHKNLVNVTLPESVTSIGSYAFGYSNIAEITIPKNVTSIGNWAFDSCDNLKIVTIENGAKFFDDSAFSYCDNITTIRGLTDSYAEAFAKEKGYTFESIGIYDVPEFSYEVNEDGETLTITGYNRFADTVEIPSEIDGKKVTAIGGGVFSNCETILKEVIIDEGIVKIEGNAFGWCESLVNVTLPESLTSVCYSAFYGCVKLTEITIPQNVTTLGDCAFGYCHNLKIVTIENGTQFFDDSAFSDCNNITTIRGLTGSYAEAFAKEKGYTFESIGTYEVPEFNYDVNDDGETITITGYNKSDDTIEIPAEIDGKKVTVIGTGVLAAISTTKAIVVPEGVTTIKDGAFSGNSNLVSVTIPESVTSIGYSVFSGCNVNLVIYGYSGSAIESYAKNNNLTFEAIGTPVTPKAETVTSDIPSGTYSIEQKVTLSTATEGAVIYYTTDGSEPEILDGVVTNWKKYDGAISVLGEQSKSMTTTIRAIALCQDMDNSDIAEFTYTINIPHEHNYSDEWTTDNTYHWHECIAAGCAEASVDGVVSISGKASHTAGEWIVDKEATVEAEGSRHKECTECGYVMETEKIDKLVPPHKHNYSDKWTTDNTYHWHECIAAGCAEASVDGVVSISGKASHTAGEWIVDKEATVEAEGSRHKECTECGYVMETEKIDKLVPPHKHNYSDKWTTDNTYHWHECIAEGCAEASADGVVSISGKAKHTAGEWIVDKEATVEAEGSRHKECTVCGYVMETEKIDKLVPPHKHNYSDKWTTDNTYHWHECIAEGCAEASADGVVSISGKAKHTAGEWIVDKEATVEAEGSRHKECTVCGYVMQTESIAKLTSAPNPDPTPTPTPDPDPEPTPTPDKKDDNGNSLDEIGWHPVDGESYWYENGERQGVKYNADGSIDTSYRGKEIYDPSTDAWYWLDNVQNGAIAKSKDVYQESLAGDWGETTDENGNKIGKWVRYDENGHMVKGWQTTEAGTYYFDLVYGTMAKGNVTIDGKNYIFDQYTGILLSEADDSGNSLDNDGWHPVSGESYWYENGERQGVKYNDDGSVDTSYRGKEIYDPSTNAWYWLDNVQSGAIAKNKDVYQDSLAGQWGDRTNENGEKIGKWVRYDENGHMVKGWQTTEAGTYYFDPIFGTMAKGEAVIDGQDYYFDIYTGVLQ